jgi:hypothetical protein
MQKGLFMYTPSEDSIEDYNAMRGAIQNQVDMLRLDIPVVRSMHPEVGANVMLAIRHLEDAKMRLGKAIQYAGDGISCYDKKNV